MPHQRKYSLNPDKTLAILVGIDQYEDFAQVDPAPSNVNELANILADEEIFGIPRSRIKMMIGGRSAEIKEGLFDIFEKMHGQDLETLIFYFVGHGYRRPNGDYYLAAEDSKKRLLRLDGSTGIAFDTVKQIIEQSRIPQKLVFLDSCYSGSTTLGEEETAGHLSLKGTYTISSSDSREVSYFDPEHSHTLFTGELIKILRTGLDGVGERIRLDELYGALKHAVRKRNPKMSPQQLGSQEITGGNYLFCKNLQFNAQAAQRKVIEKALAAGDANLKEKALHKAEHQYLKAKHLAEEHALLPDFGQAIQARMEKLRYAEELHGDWKSGQEEAVGETVAASWFQKNKVLSFIGAGLVVGLIGLVIFFAGNSGGDDASGGKQGEDLSQGETSNALLPPQDPERPLTGPEMIQRIERNMVTVRGGSYTRGCTFEQADECEDNEKPIAKVTIDNFQLNRYEVTQEEWRAVMGADPAELMFPDCDRCPVEKVSWTETQEFIHRLNEKTGRAYRMPTEAEWEYAARGGQDSKEFRYAGGGKLEKVAWYVENSDEKTHPVGQLKPNELGIYDMSGNVYEWCQDHFHDSYEGSPVHGEAWEDPDGFKRSLRGGSWDHPAKRARVCSRSSWSPVKRYKDVGIRLAHGF